MFSYNFLLMSTCCNLWSFIFICHCSISSAKKIQSKFAFLVISYRKWVKLRGEPGSCEWHLSPILWQLTHITSHHKVWLQIQGAPAHDNVLQRQLSGLGGQIRITLRYMRKTVGGGWWGKRAARAPIPVIDNWWRRSTWNRGTLGSHWFICVVPPHNTTDGAFLRCSSIKS